LEEEILKSAKQRVLQETAGSELYNKNDDATVSTEGK
jgi:hypothetical protein